MTTIKHITETRRRMTRSILQKDTWGRPVMDELRREVHACEYEEEKVSGWAEVSRSGSRIGELYPTESAAEGARYIRVQIQQERHRATVGHLYAATDHRNIGFEHLGNLPSEMEARGRAWKNSRAELFRN